MLVDVLMNNHIEQGAFRGKKHEEKNDCTVVTSDADHKQLLLHG